MVLTELQPLNYEGSFLVTPTSSGSGGLALLWKNDIDVNILTSNPNFIDTIISFKGTSFNGTFVYGAPDWTKRQEVWDSLADISASRNAAWFLTGDFNEITDNSEKAGGRERPESSF